MNAQSEGFGSVVLHPRTLHSQLGNVVFIEERGVIRSLGSLFDDDDFKNLVHKSSHNLDRTSTEDKFPWVAVAFTTGGMEVKPLTEEECSAYVTPSRFWRP